MNFINRRPAYYIEGEIINSLATGGTDNALSAEQGKVLDESKQDNLTFDNAPTDASDNPVKSGGVFTALAGKQATLTFDPAPTEDSTNPVTSGGVFTALGLRLLESEFGAKWWGVYQDIETALPDAVADVITLANRKKYYIGTPFDEDDDLAIAFPTGEGVAVGDEIELYFMTGETAPGIACDATDLSLEPLKNYTVSAKFRPMIDSAGAVANTWDFTVTDTEITAEE